MRHTFRFFAFAPLLLANCSDSGKPVHVDVAYQLTCTGTPAANCVPAMVQGRIWDYVQDDGKDAYSPTGTLLGEVNARCTATGVAPGVLLVSMRTTVGGAYLDIDDLRLNETDGTFAGGNCRVGVSDGETLYGGSVVGVCSDAPPTAGSPCQITQSSIDRDAEDGPTIELRLFCTGLGNANQPTVQASVRDSQSTASPAIVRFSNCSGL